MQAGTSPTPSAISTQRSFYDYGYLSLSQQQQQPEKFATVVQQLQAANTDDERAVAREKLRSELVDVFNDDMRYREKQAKEIEERLARLKAQFESRQKAKDQIIDLQMKVLEQEADGLGFPGGQTPATSHRRVSSDGHDPRSSAARN
jgi:hypothetical protein